MSTHVVVNTYAHSATYVADKMLLSLKEIIRESGLSPEKLATDWTVLQRGIATWLGSGHLQSVKLEVFIAANGQVKSVKPLGGHPLLIDAAESAVKQWRYEPGAEGTEVVEIRFNSAD